MLTITEQEIRDIVSDPKLVETIKFILKPEWVNGDVLEVIDAIDKIRQRFPGLSYLRKSNAHIVGKVG